jgi:S1-C subfamily serine protease
VRSARPAAALAAALSLAALAGGCSLREDDEGNAVTTTVPAEPSGPVAVKRTKVNVVEGLGRDGGFDAEGIYRRLSPGVVTVIGDPGAEAEEGASGLGSGFVLDGRGYVATNAHVIRGRGPGFERAEQVYVSFADGNRVPAEVVGDDLNADVALLRIDPRGLTLTPLRLGSSRKLEVGSPVAAIGSPFGQDQSLSVGVISATGRDIDSLTEFKIGNAIQTDAAINHGNSGGPLLNGRGEVIGINAQIETTGGGGEGVGFAIPVDTVARSLEQLREQGHVDYAYLGVSTQELYPQLADRLGVDSDDGALVVTVESGGPADDAGLEAGDDRIDFAGQEDVPAGGDVIVGIDGEPVHQASDITNLVALKDPGDEVTLAVVRGSERREVTVTLGKRPERPAREPRP